MGAMGSAARDMLTERDNITVDLFRVLPLLAVMAAIALQVVSVLWPGHPFDIQAYGIGIGTLLGAAGLAVGARSYAEGGGVVSTATSTTTSTVVAKEAQ